MQVIASDQKAKSQVCGQTLSQGPPGIAWPKTSCRQCDCLSALQAQRVSMQALIAVVQVTTQHTQQRWTLAYKATWNLRAMH